MQRERERRDNPVVFFDVSLRADVVPRTAENFRRLCTGETKEPRTGRRRHYARCPFHRVVKDKFCQSGDYANHDGSGGECTFGDSPRAIGSVQESISSLRDGKSVDLPSPPLVFNDENFILRHTGAGVLSMANSGPDSNTCQFYLHFCPQPNFDGKHVVFGCLVDTESYSVLEQINAVATARGDPKEPFSFSFQMEKELVMERLVHDLKTRETLCCILDYPGVSEEDLKKYIKKHGPLVNPVFGEVHGYWVDDDYFTPYRNVVPGCCELAPKLAALVGNWMDWSGIGKRSTILLSRGAYIFDERTGKPTTVRTPDVTYISRRASRNPKDLELWQYGQEPYAPSFLVEIDYLSGEESQFVALDQKMQNQYFRHGVQLGWLIDPRPGFRKMLEYKRDEAGRVYRVDNDEWRDLDGGDVLPGFCINKTDLELDPNGDVRAERKREA
ncbi:hypothetical protein PC113_g10990 [Phytophthora cactorum]|uniref:PPIase cyclophilin-type domain-containing protein n=1 Tax=Phytophthora cactorum TaxID=29920 RepID=A0A8T0Z4S6_9STRA|nr:hypothetical protein PC113_g10990 [Phytophthora cactorum]